VSLFDHHVHSDRSDGRVSLEDRSVSVLIRPHGVSDHFPWRDKMRDDDDVLRYLDDAARLGMRVGLEYDLGVAPPLRQSTREALHYMIGAVHQIRLGGEWVRFDEAGRFMKGLLGNAPYSEAKRFTDDDLRRRILDRTLQVVREGISEVGIDILGHPTFSPLAALGDPEDVFPVDWQERLIDLCVQSRVAFEVNESYRVPHQAFLVRARERGALFSVGTDTHGEVGPLDRTEAMIRDAGLSQDRFLRGERVRGKAQAGGSTASSS
jgi:histidinol phosphatase-like PHP family hydrolase